MLPSVLSPLCLLPGWHSSFTFFSHDDEWCLSSDCSAWNHLIYSLHLGSNYVEVVQPFDIHTVELSTVFMHILFHSLCHNQLSHCVFHIHTDKHSLRWSFWTCNFFLLSSAVSSFNTDTHTQKRKFWGACRQKSNIYVWFLIKLAINNPTVPSFTCRMARVCLQLCPLVGISCCELAEVWPSPPGGALWGAAARSPPPAPAHHSLSKRHYDRGEVSVCREQPRRAFQTLRGSAALFWPIHSRHETDDWLSHSCCWPGSAEQEL